MAEGMDVGEFWLPSEFLADDFFMEGEASNSKGERRVPGVARAYTLCEFPNELGSNLSSPVESANETESDEEDHLAGLTRRMAHAFLQENDGGSLLARDHYPKMQAMAGSPQSTLCDLGIWAGSSNGSPNGPSQVSSPPSSPFEQHKDDAWDLLTAAAGQVVRLRLTDQAQQQQLHGRGLLGPPAKPSPPIPAPQRNTSNTGVYSTPLLTQQQLQAERFYQLKQQQLMKQQLSAAWGRQQSRGVKVAGGGYGDVRSGRPLGLPTSAWPPLQRHQHQQPQPGSGMRAVFLTGNGARRESSGTGVFLPRRPGNPTDMRKKSACSTVLLPDRVIQALNLNLEDTGYSLDHDAMVARAGALLAHQKRNHYRAPPAAVPNHELRLPAEWTY